MAKQNHTPTYILAVVAIVAVATIVLQTSFVQKTGMLYDQSPAPFSAQASGNEYGRNEEYSTRIYQPTISREKVSAEQNQEKPSETVMSRTAYGQEEEYGSRYLEPALARDARIGMPQQTPKPKYRN